MENPAPCSRYIGREHRRPQLYLDGHNQRPRPPSHVTCNFWEKVILSSLRRGNWIYFSRFHLIPFFSSAGTASDRPPSFPLLRIRVGSCGSSSPDLSFASLNSISTHSRSWDMNMCGPVDLYRQTRESVAQKQYIACCLRNSCLTWLIHVDNDLCPEDQPAGI